MKYRTQSANVLNEADRFETQLRWILFKQEQEAVHTALLLDTGWAPGNPLHEYPNSYLGGQYVRYMVDLLPLDRFHDEDGIKYFRARCDECEVSWEGYDPCFSCGVERAHPYAKIHFNAEYLDRRAARAFFAFETAAQRAVIGMATAQQAWAASVSESLSGLMSVRDFRVALGMTEYGIASSPVAFSTDAYRNADLAPLPFYMQSAQEREITLSAIDEWYNPSIRARGWVELPEDLDLSLPEVEIPLPERVVTQPRRAATRAFPNTPITEQRRRR